MKYLNVNDIAAKWNISERSVRNYCNQGRVVGAYIKGKTWLIPENAIKPSRFIRQTKGTRTLLNILKLKKVMH